MNTTEFVQRFIYGEGYLALCFGSPANTSFTYVKDGSVPESFPVQRDVYFGPAMRRVKGNLKEHVDGTVALWVDADDPQKPLATLPPSAAVFSGHGWHLYWFLSAPVTDLEEIERLNKILIEDVPTADKACWNANRVLRVPGTMNCKDPEKPVEATLKWTTPTVYTQADFDALKKLDKQTRHKVRTGDSRGYRSRSERDWAIIVALVNAGVRNDVIEMIFRYQPCGDKVNAPDSPPKYLQHTIEKARNRRGAGPEPTGGDDGYVIEGQDGYYVPGRRGGNRKISTFIMDPTILLDGSEHGAEDALVVDIRANNYEWGNITFSRSAFTSVARLDKETPVAAWQWLGRDEDLRHLLPFLLKRLQEKGFPKVNATPVLGLHNISGVPYFVGNAQVIGPQDIWRGFEGPVAWLPTKKEHPELELVPEVTDGELEMLRTDIPLLNEEGALWPMLGWYAVAPIKTWIEQQGHRFPILNVVGTKGSGKTTLIQRVFMPLFGQTDPKSYDAGTTKFVILAILGSTNGVPVAFSEFRYEAVEKFLRIVLLSYDTGHDPRGRGDQTTVDYALTAPFSVDGEDLIEDPAARERLIVAHLHPQTVDEGSESYQAYQRLRVGLPLGFGGYYIQMLLGMLQSGEMKQLLLECREKVYSAFPGKLPDRVRSNHVVAYLGCVLWARAVGCEPPDPQVLTRSITSVYDIKTGRSRTLSDAMVEDISNEAARHTQQFKWNTSGDGSVLYFQLTSAHGWWISNRRRQGRGALERDAIRSQLREAPYMLETKSIDDVYMFGIDLQQAQNAGLDVPSKILAHTFSVKFS